MAKATLLVIQGDDQGTRFEVDDSEVGIGRSPRNEIRILDTEISRMHASLEFRANSFVLTDRDSSNGTFVNGVAIKSSKLKSGDQIQLGRSAILFSETEAESDSRVVSASVDLLSRRDPADRSKIVGEVGQDFLASTKSVATDSVAQTLVNLQVLYQISEEAVRPSESIENVLQRILDLTIRAVAADRGCILLTDPQTDDLVPQLFSGKSAVEDQSKMPVSRSIVDYVVQKGQGVRTSNARSDSRFGAGQSILQAGINEALCVPMQGRYELMGVIYVDTTIPAEQAVIDGSGVSKFSEEKLRLLVAIGRQAALAIEDNRYQHAFVKAERLAAMGQTIATLSHHIKNILQGVRGGSYLIDMGLKDHNEELVGKGWKIVEKNQNKIYHLVMDMLTFSKERQPVWQKSSLNQCVTDVCELMQSRAEENQVQLDCELSEAMPETTFDPEAMHQAILNVVTNGIDAVEGTESARVVVQSGYDASSDEVFVQVDDNGAGIPADQLANIFNIFESTKGARGTGLGLAVSQKILREHGGEITAENRPDGGCRIRIAWPQLDDAG